MERLSSMVDMATAMNYDVGKALRRKQRPPIKDEPSWAVRSKNLTLDSLAERQVREDHFGSRWVMSERNGFRHWWVLVIAILLIYTATFFLYRICFEDLKIPEPAQASSFWLVFDEIVNVIFWLDLVLNFFFTYQDDQGSEVDSLKRIALHYLKGAFIVNLIACNPVQLIGDISDQVTDSDPDDGSNTLQGGSRIVRLQRVSRLARLLRLTRLLRLSNLSLSEDLWKRLNIVRGIRIVNYIFALAFATHLLACGWYVCAAIHVDRRNTWVYRRLLGEEEIPLAYLDSGDHYVHSMYFVLTVFTTVGFGDISAFTTGEILYVSFTMVVGAIVHSIIVSEVINIVTATDRKSAFVNEQQCLFKSYAIHTEMDVDIVEETKKYLSVNAGTWMTSRFNRDAMKDMINGRYLPRKILDSLPYSLFNGELMLNAFLNPTMVQLAVPPRLPLILALGLRKAHFKKSEVIYQKGDHAFNIFLVMEGTFAFIGTPTFAGGIDDLVRDMNDNLSTRPSADALDQGGAAVSSTRTSALSHLFPYKLFGRHSYFGDGEMVWNRTRVCTTRCESQTGVALVLHKVDFIELSETFPPFACAWKIAADQHEAKRRRMLAQLTEANDCSTLAARMIQGWWRSRPWMNTRKQQKVGPRLSARTAMTAAAREGAITSPVSATGPYGNGSFGSIPKEFSDRLLRVEMTVELIFKELQLLRKESSERTVAAL